MPSMRRLTLLAAAATPGTRRASFPIDEAIVPEHAFGAERPTVHRGDACLRGPERRCADTARALGLEAESVRDLSSWGLGSWAGRAVADVSAREPEAFAAWRTRPDAAPHGGEALTVLLDRVAAWMERPAGARVVAVADASVVRAAAVHALDAQWRAFWRLDVPPLSMTILTHGLGEWRVRCIAAPLRPRTTELDRDA
jgi:broad specificity phosphatase PhoE